MNQPIQRSGLPLLFLAAVVLAAGLGLVLLFATPLPDFLLGSGTGRSSTAPPAEIPLNQPEEPMAENDKEPLQVKTDESAGQPTDSTPSTETSRESTPQAVAVTHRVNLGDTLFDLAGRYWADPYLWPVLLVANAETVIDPDFLRRGLVLNIPPDPAPADGAGTLEESAINAIVGAHLEAYQRYRRLGDDSIARGRTTGNMLLIQRGLFQVNKSHWVLYSGLRYDENLLDRADATVSEEDISTVRAYVTRFGPRPGG